MKGDSALDSAALLSTISQSSAAMIAIIGGFLVSKLVAISSEREGLKRQIKSVTQRLEIVRDEFVNVHENRIRASEIKILNYLVKDLVKAEDGAIDYVSVVEDHLPRGANVEELVPYARELHQAVLASFEVIKGMILDDDNNELSLSDLEERGFFMSEDSPAEEINYQVFEHIRERLPRRPRGLFNISTPFVSALGPITPSWVHETNARRYDELIRDEARLGAEMAVLEREANIITVEYERLGHPVGVVPAVWILALFSVLGIVVPVTAMAFFTIDTNTKIWLIAFFIAGLLSVLGYIVWYLRSIKVD